MQRPPLTFARFVAAPQNRSALLAVQEVAACVCSGRPRRTINPLFLHGTPGTGRLALLQEKARGRVAVGPDVLAWLAEHLNGSRELEGALTRLEALGRLERRAPDVAAVADHFREQAEAGRVTVERIAQRVG